MQQKKLYADFSRFAEFPDAILREIVREGELEMQARLTAAIAADQRALSLVGYQTTAIIALIGAIYALTNQVAFDYYLTGFCVAEIFALIIACYCALDSVTPRKYAFPGNSPANWEITLWHHPPKNHQEADIRTAMSEQSYNLYSAIHDNKILMVKNAQSTRTSLQITFWFSLVISIACIFRLLTKSTLPACVN